MLLDHPLKKKDKSMHQNWSVKQTVSERCLSMGLGLPLSLSLEKEIRKYLTNSGPAWTVRRLRSLRMDIIRLRAGLPPLTWVRRNRKGNWFGIWGQLRKLALSSERSFKVVCNSLTAYSALKPHHPTDEHVQAMYANLGKRPVDVTGEKFFIPYRVPDIEQGEIQPLIMFSGKSSVKAPIFEGPSVPQDSSLEKELDWFRDEANFSHFVRFRNLYGPILRDLVIPDQSTPFLGGPPIISSGRLIPLMKDGGWKVRWIASPYRIHQMALKPFGERLFQLLRRFPWDYTHDQEKAIPKLQKVLSKGKYCHSIDLDSSTDNFPLSFQIHLLRQMNPSALWQESVDLFHALSRGGWEYGNKLLSWRKGQPMGLYPSFPSFAAAHGLLLNNLSEGRDAFVVLGDDVVIWDDEVHHRYMEVLSKWDVPISASKTISSSKLCEFAGAVITESHVFRNYKWKNIDDENFLALMQQFGKRFCRSLTWRQRRVYNLVASLQPPVGCNHGVTDVVQSVAATSEWSKDKLERGSRSLGFFTWCKHHVKLARSVLWRQTDIQQTFDEKVMRSIDQTPLRGLRGDPKPFADVLRACRCEPDTPNLFFWGTVRPSTLQIYEERLNLSRKEKSG